MPKYLFEVNYVGDGVKGLLKDGGTGRRAVAEKLFSSVGARIEGWYYAFGDVDLYVIADVPDHATAASIALNVSAAGTAKARTIVLLTQEEADAAGKKSPVYTPPGR
ncbi:MAG TPA: GYD domain-containing protein [Anaerolineae bacterium]